MKSFISIGLLSSALLVSILFGRVLGAFADILAEIKTENLSLDLISDGATYQLTVRSLSPNHEQLRAEALAVHNPSRLVLDISGYRSKEARSLTLNNQHLSALRVGVHPDKTRIVIDLKNEGYPEYQLSSAEEVKLKFSFTNGQIYSEAKQKEAEKKEQGESESEIAQVKQKEETIETSERPSSPSPGSTPTQVEKAAKPDTLKKKDSSKSKEQEEKKESAQTVSEQTVAPLTEASPAPLPTSPPNVYPAGQASVKAIYYQTTDNTTVSAVAFDIEGLISYTLNKRKTDLYELILESSHLIGPHLSLPQFPPDSFQGFVALTAQQEGNNVKVSVHVEENVKLFPYVAKSQLWLKVAQ